MDNPVCTCKVKSIIDDRGWYWTHNWDPDRHHEVRDERIWCNVCLTKVKNGEMEMEYPRDKVQLALIILEELVQADRYPDNDNSHVVREAMAALSQLSAGVSVDRAYPCEEHKDKWKSGEQCPWRQLEALQEKKPGKYVVTGEELTGQWIKSP